MAPGKYKTETIQKSTLVESKFLHSSHGTDTRPVIKVQKPKHKRGHSGTLREIADRATQRGQQTGAQCAAIEGVEDTQDKLSCCREVSRHRGRREHGDRGERVSNGRHHLRGFRCLYSALSSGGYLKASSRDGAQCGSRPSLALQGAVNGEPQWWADKRGWVGATESVKTHPCFPRFHLCVELPHRESCKLSA